MTVEATRGEVAGHAMKLEEELEHTKRVHGETTERLVSRSADVESVTKSLVSFHNDEVKGEECFVLEQFSLNFVNYLRLQGFALFRWLVLKSRAAPTNAN